MDNTSRSDCRTSRKLKKTHPDSEVTPERFAELRPAVVQELEIAFDEKRIRKLQIGMTTTTICEYGMANEWSRLIGRAMANDARITTDHSALKVPICSPIFRGYC